MRDLDQIQSSRTLEKLRWSDFSQKFEFQTSEWYLVRAFGKVWTDYRHVVTTKSGKRYYEYCHAWNSEKDEFMTQREDACECCRLQSAGKVGAGGQKITGQYRYFINIIQYVQMDSKVMAKGIFLLEMSKSLCEKLQDLKGANGGISVTDPQKGALLLIKCDKNQDPSNMYSASIDTKNIPISEDAYKLVVRQKYPGGTVKNVPANGLPPQFEYIRTTSHKNDIHRSLVNNGYFQMETGESELDRVPANVKVFRDIPPPENLDYVPDNDLMPY